MSTKTFETNRLILRATTVNDASFIVELLNTPKWLKYIGDRNVHTIEDAVRYIKDKFNPHLKQYGYSTYSVIKKDDHTIIGTCGLYNREDIEGVDIGFAFLPEYEGKGYAFEAANRLKQAAFEDFNLSFIKAITLPNNTSSQKLLERLGFTFKSLINIPNDEETLMLYELKA